MSDREEALEKRNRLVTKIMAQYDMTSDPLVLTVASLDDFFEPRKSSFV